MDDLEKNDLGFYKWQELFDIVSGKNQMPLSLALKLQTMRTIRNYPFKVISDFLIGRDKTITGLGEKLCRVAIERLKAQGSQVDEADWFY